MDAPEEKLTALGLELPSPASAAGNYLPAKRVNDLLYLSGALPTWNGQVKFAGRLGEGVSVEDGYQAARLCVLNLLAAAKAQAGSLDQIAQIISVRGYVNCAPDFAEQPAVINGASDLLVAVFGEAGRHVRAAVGVAGLPKGVAVEVEMVAQLRQG